MVCLSISQEEGFMTEEQKLDIIVSARLFWRYFWRIALFTIAGMVGTGGASHWWITKNHYTGVQAHNVAEWFTLVFLILLLIYGMGIWAGRLVTRPMTVHGERISVTVVRKNGQPIHPLAKALACWWGFNWRNSLIFVVGTGLLGAITKNPDVLVTGYLLLVVLGGIGSMWWWIFHPLGKIHLVLQKDST